MNTDFDLLKAIFIFCSIPGIMGFLFQLILMAQDTSIDDNSDIDSGEVADSFSFKLSWTVICNFLFCFGVVGFILYPSKLALPIAIATGCSFAYSYAYLLYKIHKFCINSENKIPKPQHGMLCKSNTSLDENRTGSVIIRINEKDYEYLAKSSNGIIPNNTVCVIMGIVDGIAYVIKAKEETND